MKKQNQASRREVIQGALTAGSLLKADVLVQLLAGSFIKEAHADGSMSDVPMLWNHHINGGIPAWSGMVPMTPWGYGLSGDEASKNMLFTPNVYVKTHYNEITKQATYMVDRFEVHGKDYFLPPLWSDTMPYVQSTGVIGSRPMIDLFEQLLVVRGIRMPGDIGHESFAYMQLRPSSGPSLSGAVASASPAPVAVGVKPLPGGFGTTSSFHSETGSAQVVLNTFTYTHPNPIGEIVNAFKKPLAQQDPLQDRRQLIAETIDQAHQVLVNFAASRQKGAREVGAQLGKAKDWMTRNLGAIESEYTAALAIYRSLIEASLASGLPTVYPNGTPVSDGSEAFRIAGNHRLDSDGSNVSGPVYLKSGENLGSLIDTQTANKKTFIDSMAESFALAEIAAKYRICSSLTTSNDGLKRLRITDTADRLIRGNFSNDEHAEGRPLPGMFLYTHYVKAQNTCLYHFRERCKANSVWDKVVVFITTDCNRNPRNDGLATDHGWKGLFCWMMSGLLPHQPMVVGDIVNGEDTNPPAQGYSGTWGIGAPSYSFGYLNMGHMVSTAAHLLRVKSPTPNFQSLVEYSGQTVVLAPGITDAKNSVGGSNV